MRFLIAASLLALAVVQPGAAADLSAYKRPLTVPFEGVTAYSPQLATLGKMLFFDPRLSGNKNMNRHTDRHYVRTLGANGQLERDNISVRTTGKVKQRAAKGGFHGGPIPYGYRLAVDAKGKRALGDSGYGYLEIFEPEAVIVRRMVREILEGRSLRAIANALNSEGVPAPRGGLWHATSVRNTVLRPSAAGIRIHKGKELPVNWSGILDRAQWLEICGYLHERRPILLTESSSRAVTAVPPTLARAMSLTT